MTFAIVLEQWTEAVGWIVRDIMTGKALRFEIWAFESKPILGFYSGAVAFWGYNEMLSELKYGLHRMNLGDYRQENYD